MTNDLGTYVGKEVTIVLPVFPDEEMMEDCRDNPPSGERIWVEVSRVEGGSLIGYLANQPVFASGMFGDEVVFKEEEIIDVSRGASDRFAVSRCAPDRDTSMDDR